MDDSPQRHLFIVAVPVFHGAAYMPGFLAAVKAQSVRPVDLLFIDSSPDDLTSNAIRQLGHDTVRVDPKSFDHGATRNYAVDLAASTGAEVVVLMTQDAVLADESGFENLLAEFTDERVAAVFGRQLPRPSASPLERANRQVRYPIDRYVANEERGNRRFFLSNAFAAYRIRALREVGGFPSPTIFGEDAAASYRLQAAGHLVIYQPNALVVHSHPVRLITELRRFFDVGVAARQFTTPAEWSSKASGARSTIQEWAVAHRLGGVSTVLVAIAVTAARVAGLLLGRITCLPVSIGARLAYSKAAYLRVRADEEKVASDAR